MLRALPPQATGKVPLRAAAREFRAGRCPQRDCTAPWGHQTRRGPGAGSCWAWVGRGQRRLANEGIDCETGTNDPRLSSVDLFFKNPSLNLTKCSDAPAQAPVGPSGVGKESWHHFWTFRLRSESFLGSLYPDCPSPSLLPWLGLAGVPGGPGLPSAGPSAALGPTKAAPLHVY